MKRYWGIIFAILLTACTLTPAQHSRLTNESSFQQTKLFAITADAETQIAGAPKNGATITAIVAAKYESGTAAAAAMTAQPSLLTPVPTIPSDSPLCRPGDLKTEFKANAATQQILLGAGLTNISGVSCFLQTWPQVTLVDQKGQPVDVSYHNFELGSPHDGAATQQVQEPNLAATKTGLFPGWTAWVNLDWQNWCGKPISDGAVIRLTLLDHAGVIDIVTGIGSGGPCNAPDHGSSIGISNVVLAKPAQ